MRTASPPTEPGDEDIPLEFGQESEDAPLWDPVEDLDHEDVAIEPGARIGTDDSWSPTADVETDDLRLEIEALEEPSTLWEPLTGTAPLLLGELAAAVPALPEPRGVRALVTGQSPSQLPSPRATLPWQGEFEAEELADCRLIYTVTLESLRTELAVVDWQWSDPKEEGGKMLRIRLSDDGEDLELTATEGEDPVVSLRGFLGDRELRFDVLLVKGRARRGLLLGRDVLSEGFLVDPSTDLTDQD